MNSSPRPDVVAVGVDGSDPAAAAAVDWAAAEADRRGSSLVVATVVGSWGRGGFVSLVLGSVSHAVMHDCAAPVMIVR